MKISLGIDYSYEETGFAVVREDGIILHISCLNFLEIEKKFKIKLSHAYRRLLVRQKIKKLLKEYNITDIVVERVRLFSRGFISLATSIALGELVATIVDATLPDDMIIIITATTSIIPVYSTETRVWKKRIHNNAKATKSDTIQWAKALVTVELMKQRKWRLLTHNEADALALAKFFFHPDACKFLKKEE